MGIDTHIKQLSTDRSDLLPSREWIGINDDNIVMTQLIGR